MPQQQRQRDRRDQREDEIGLAEVTALEPARTQHLADVHRGAHPDEHEHREQVDEKRVPPLVAKPRQCRVLVNDADHRDQDRREQHDEAPEDERVHQPRHEALEQLALPEHDRRLVLHPPPGVERPIDRLSAAYQAAQKQRAPHEQRATDGNRGRERNGGDDGDYVPLVFRISAEIAGTISCRSPITA